MLWCFCSILVRSLGMFIISVVFEKSDGDPQYWIYGIETLHGISFPLFWTVSRVYLHEMSDFVHTSYRNLDFTFPVIGEGLSVDGSFHGMLNMLFLGGSALGIAFWMWVFDNYGYFVWMICSMGIFPICLFLWYSRKSETFSMFIVRLENSKDDRGGDAGGVEA